MAFYSEKKCCGVRLRDVASAYEREWVTGGEAKI